MALANLSQAAALGFSSGQQAAPTNPLGEFVRGMLEKQKEREAVSQAYGLEAFKAGLKKPELDLQREKLKQESIGNAYDIAKDIMSDYLESPDPEDDNPLATGQALAAGVFDQYMQNLGYEDITFASLSGPTKVVEEEEGKSPSFVQQFIPESIKEREAAGETVPTGEKVGSGIGVLGRQLLQETGKVPSRTVGVGAHGYNLLADITSGVTGIQQKRVPKSFTDVMMSGQLFDVQNAFNFYRDIIRKKLLRKK